MTDSALNQPVDYSWGLAMIGVAGLAALLLVVVMITVYAITEARTARLWPDDECRVSEDDPMPDFVPLTRSRFVIVTRESACGMGD